MAKGCSDVHFDASYVVMAARVRELHKMTGLGKFIHIGMLQSWSATALFIKSHDAAWVRFIWRWSNARTLTHDIQETMFAYVGVDVAHVADEKVDAVNRKL